MVFAPGCNANPLGSKKRTIWTAAIEKALSKGVRGGKIDLLAIDKCAEALVKAGIEGDVAALKEIGDRIEGRARTNDAETPQNGLMILNVADLTNIILAIGRSRNITLPSSLRRIAEAQVGDVQALPEAERIS